MHVILKIFILNSMVKIIAKKIQSVKNGNERLFLLNDTDRGSAKSVRNNHNLS